MSTLLFPTRDPTAFSALKRPSAAGVGRQRSDSAHASSQCPNGTKTIRLSLAGLGTRPSLSSASPAADSSFALAELIAAFPTVLAADRDVASASTSGPSYERLYALCRDLTLHKVSTSSPDASNLLDAYQKAITDRATASARELRGTAMSLRGAVNPDSHALPAFLEALLADFARFELAINRLGGVLLHLEAYVTVATDPTQAVSLRDRALRVYQQTVLEDAIVKDRAEVDVVTWSRRARKAEQARNLEPVQQMETDGDNVDAAAEATVKRYIDMALLLAASCGHSGQKTGLDGDDSPLEVLDAYLRETKRFYAEAVEEVAAPAIAAKDQDMTDASDSLSIGAASTFIRWLDASYASERARAMRLFSGGSTTSGQVIPSVSDRAWRRVKPELDATLSDDDHLLRLAQSALVEAMARSDAQTLRRLYLALINVRKFSDFKRLFSEHVAARCKRLIGDPANDARMVGDLLTFKRFCERSIDLLYAHQEDASTDRTADGVRLSPVEQRRRLALEAEMRDGIRAGVETRQAVPAEMIAKHLDAVLRRGQGATSAAEFDTQLDEIVALVKFTKDKDVFKQFYVAQLAKRLLLGRSASNEEEMSMVRKLQREYGEEFTTGDAMMKDLTQSEEMNKKFAEVRSKNGKPPSELSVYVLSQGQWPPYTALGKGWEKFTLPSSMQKSLDEFAAWYGHTFSGRVLTWRHQHTSVTLTARFPGGNKEIGVSLFQAIVLMQFNEADSLSFEEIYERTGIERSELVRTLQSLYALKATRMLVKRPPGKDVDLTDQFLWHRSFTRDRIKFKINQLQQDLSAEESRQTSAKVFEDRTLTLDAQIVRIMKGKKKLRLAELVNGVVDAVKNMFQPEVKAIKTQVESLIEREYLERDEEDRNMLKYLA